MGFYNITDRYSFAIHAIKKSSEVKSLIAGAKCSSNPKFFPIAVEQLLRGGLVEDALELVQGFLWESALFQDEKILEDVYFPILEWYLKRHEYLSCRRLLDGISARLRSFCMISEVCFSNSSNLYTSRRTVIPNALTSHYLDALLLAGNVSDAISWVESYFGDDKITANGQQVSTSFKLFYL